MSITSSATAPILTTKRLVIDCSHFDSERDSPAITQFLEWVRVYPERAAIQVYLRPAQNRDSRSLRYALQKLGCTVTARA